jgi:hypothetical protein
LQLNVQSGWLGDYLTKAIFPYGGQDDQNSETSWLIDEEFANQWRLFQLD